MKSAEIETLIKHLGKLPGLGARSGKRAALHLLQKKEEQLKPLIAALQTALDTVENCDRCGNLDTKNNCSVCTDPRRDQSILCVVEQVADLWAMERSGAFSGLYHILGGHLSALDGIGPDQLTIHSLLQRLQQEPVQEIIVALNATVEGQATAHYLADQVENHPVLQPRIKDGTLRLTRLAHGVPVGGELDYMDDGTISTALKARRAL